MLDAVMTTLGNIVDSAFGPSSWVHPIYLLAMLPMGYFVYLRRRPEMGFWSWFLPKDILQHPSHWVNFQLFAVNVFVKLSGIVNLTTIRVLVFAGVFSLLGGEITARTPDTLSLWWMTLIIFVSGDFSAYLAHRMSHQIKLIWAFHAVHHSVEVLTPLAVYRTHPFAQFISRSVASIISGIVLAFALAYVAPSTSLIEVAGVSVLFYIFNILGAIFRHSHIWISFGPMIGRIVVSPAFHQIHHSTDPKHWDKNYGNMLAIWDWMFGSMYLPEKEETLEFGLSYPDGSRIAQPHPTLAKALWVPFRDTFHYFDSGRDPAFPERSPQEVKTQERQKIATG